MTDCADGASVQGRSTSEPDRHEDGRAANQRAGRRHDRIETLEAAPEDRRARVADGGGDDGELRQEFAAETAQRLHADDEADAGRCRRRRPMSLRAVTGSWRVMAAVSRKVKIGEVEFRMVARPASTVRSAQAISVKGMTLLRHA